MDNTNRTPKEIFQEIKFRILTPIVLLAIMWSIKISEIVLGKSLAFNWGVIPRSGDHLFNIFSMPFLHGDMNHLISNSGPFLIFSLMILTQVNAWKYLKTFLLISILGGVMLWGLGRESIHIGASGVVFGFWGFLVGNAIFRKSFLDFIISATVMVLYGGILYGVLPTDAGISWEGHLFGLIGGVAASYLLHSKDDDPAASSIRSKNRTRR